MGKTEDAIAEHLPRLRRYARALTGDVSRDDDLVQDTLERALTKFGLWRHGSDLRAWLFTIMHHVHVNQGLRHGRVSWQAMEEAGWDAPVPAQQERALEMRDLERALARLPVEYREVLLLVALEGLRYEDVARVVGVPVGTVMSRLARGREKLRRLLDGEAAPVLRRVK